MSQGTGLAQGSAHPGRAVGSQESSCSHKGGDEAAKTTHQRRLSCYFFISENNQVGSLGKGGHSKAPTPHS